MNASDFRSTDLGYAIEALSVTIADLKTDKSAVFDGMYDEVLAVVGEDCFRFGMEGDKTFIKNAMGGLRVFALNPPNSLLARIAEVEREVARA